MSRYAILKDKEHEEIFFFFLRITHFTDVLVTDRRFSHGPITALLNVTESI